MMENNKYNNVGVEYFQPTSKKEDKLEKIAERVYNASFILTAILILGASLGTAIVRYLSGSEIILVPDNVFKFIEHVLYIFAIPQSIKIIGDKLPLIVQAIVAVRGNGYGHGSSNLTNQPYPFSGVNQFGNTTHSTGSVQATYPPTGQFDPNNIPNDAIRQE